MRLLLLVVCPLSVLVACLKEPPPRESGLGASVAGMLVRDSIGRPVVCRSDSVTAALTTSFVPRSPSDTFSPYPIDTDLDSALNIYVLDSELRKVRVFGRNGDWKRDLGSDSIGYRLSQGALGMAVSAAGNVYIWDRLKQQVVVLSPSSGLSQAFTVFGIPAYGIPYPIAVDDSGNVAVYVQESVRAGAPDMRESVRLFGPRGVSRSVIGGFLARSTLRVANRGTVSTITLPFDLADRVQWALSPSGILLLAQTRSYTVAALDHGDTIWTVHRDVQPLEVTNDDVASAMSLAGTTGFTAADVRQVIPRFKSPVLELLISSNWFLVRRPIIGPHVYEASYDLYRPGEDRPCATISLPGRLMAVRGDFGVGLAVGKEGPTRVFLLSLKRRP